LRSAGAARAALVGAGAGRILANRNSCFRRLAHNLPTALAAQHAHEAKRIADGAQIKHSSLLQALADMAGALGMETVLMASVDDEATEAGIVRVRKLHCRSY
jgi:hypothetical protein